MGIETISKEEERPLNRRGFVRMEEIRETEAEPDQPHHESQDDDQDEVKEDPAIGVNPFFPLIIQLSHSSILLPYSYTDSGVRPPFTPPPTEVRPQSIFMPYQPRAR